MTAIAFTEICLVSVIWFHRCKEMCRKTCFLFLTYLGCGENFRKRIRKFGKRCFLDVHKCGEDNVYTTVM